MMAVATAGRFSGGRVVAWLRPCASLHWHPRDPPASRRLSSRPQLDLDALMSANKYGGSAAKPPQTAAHGSNALDDLMNKNRYGGSPKPRAQQPAPQEVLVNYSPEFPHDIDVGPLFCTRAQRCFLDGGKRCGEYQTGKRNKGMLEDLFRACTDTGFFFMHNTFLTNKDLEEPFNHMAAIYAEEEDRPGGLGIPADLDDTCLGFSRPGIDTAKPGMVANHVAFCVRKEAAANPITNKWPPAKFRPGLKEDLVRFYDKMDAISNKIAQALCDMTGLPSDFVDRVRSDRCMSGLQLLHFPPTENVRTDGQGLSIAKDTAWRTDPGLFLLISQTEPCFQVQDTHGNTCNLRCGAERWVVLLGDAIEIMTNGLIKATKYRVVPRKGERAALEFAARLDPEAPVAPHPLFIEAGADLYPSTTQAALMSSRVDGLSCYTPSPARP